MTSDILIIGGGASGLMAAYSAADALVSRGSDASVTVLEKMPRPGRKIMISGKGRCNFTNLKDWNDFSVHVRSKPNVLKSSFYNLTPEAVISFFEEYGMKTVVERGDRAFPASYHASDVVDTLVGACRSKGVKIVAGTEVSAVEALQGGFSVTATDGSLWKSKVLVIATGGLSYPGTGSTGDGYKWAAGTGHKIVPTFPSLTALVPKGYKISGPDALRHIDRSEPLSESGGKFCGVSLKNVGVRLFVEGTLAGEEFGDLDFTDGGIEGPVGFLLSRKAVKSLLGGSRVALEIDLKSGVPAEELSDRVGFLWKTVCSDPRSRSIKEKEKVRILLGKLMPWDLIPGFLETNPQLLKTRKEKGGRTVTTFNVDALPAALRSWRFEIAGYVGYERAVITAGGVDTSDIVAKTLESRIVPGLYFCGELLDLDADTGGYNLQIAFSTGAMAGRSAALSILDR